MPVRTLKDLAIRACLKHINEITTVGDLPFHVVGGIIEKIQRPEQLMAIEKASPHIRSHTAGIWRGFIQRDFPSADKNMKPLRPRSPDNWADVYRRYKKLHEEGLAASLASLKSSMSALKAAKDEKTSKTMTPDSIRNLHYLPPVTKKRWGAPSGGGVDGSSSLNFTKGTRTKILSGASIMRKVRREASEIATIRGSLSSTGALWPRGSRLAQAPAAMVNDRRIAKQAAFRPSAPAARHEPRRDGELRGNLSVEDIECNYISDQDEDDDDQDEEDVDNVFDELPPVNKKKVMMNARVAQTPVKPTLSQPNQAAAAASQGPPQILARKRKPTGDPFLAKRKRIT